MSILADEDTRVVVQGMTGREGMFHTARMIEYGTVVRAGVTPGKGGRNAGGVPVFNTVAEAVESEQVNTSCIFVPPPFAADAVMEAAAAGIRLIICITEGIPVLDALKVVEVVKERGSILIGPNCPGVISPGKTKVGIMPGPIHRPGNIGVISRSGTLTYEVVDQLSREGLGQSSCIGIGGDPIVGSSFIDLLEMFRVDDQTHGVVLVGEIGGNAEEQAAAYIIKNFDKPVVSFIAGRSAPPGKRMGHAGAIISGGQGGAEEKIRSMKDAGITVCLDLPTLGSTVKSIMTGSGGN
ncbi:MAG TPA: succinate--CoA ligase subunit alpha [Desulfobacteraceae bacterium]|nr:succinate--CoA ligase subunit alpha [Desulfobacteraceae bacterium]